MGYLQKIFFARTGCRVREWHIGWKKDMLNVYEFD